MPSQIFQWIRHTPSHPRKHTKQVSHSPLSQSSPRIDSFLFHNVRVLERASRRQLVRSHAQRKILDKSGTNVESRWRHSWKLPFFRVRMRFEQEVAQLQRKSTTRDILHAIVDQKLE